MLTIVNVVTIGSHSSQAGYWRLEKSLKKKSEIWIYMLTNCECNNLMRFLLNALLRFTNCRFNLVVYHFSLPSACALSSGSAHLLIILLRRIISLDFEMGSAVVLQIFQSSLYCNDSKVQTSQPSYHRTLVM